MKLIRRERLNGHSIRVVLVTKQSDLHKAGYHTKNPTQNEFFQALETATKHKHKILFVHFTRPVEELDTDNKLDDIALGGHSEINSLD